MRAASAPSVRSGKHVYATLDGIRGIAAALVAMRHAGALFPGWDFPNSGLAVDLFFVISGFVVASAYDRRLADGLTLGAFMRIRLIRLYPLYLAWAPARVRRGRAVLAERHRSAAERDRAGRLPALRSGDAAVALQLERRDLSAEPARLVAVLRTRHQRCLRRRPPLPSPPAASSPSRWFPGRSCWK